MDCLSEDRDSHCSVQEMDLQQQKGIFSGVPTSQPRTNDALPEESTQVGGIHQHWVNRQTDWESNQISKK